MVFTAAQTTAFFTQPVQLAIPAATLPGLALEGISSVGDLEEFDDDDFDTIMSNLRKPTGMVPNPMAGAGANGIPAMVPQPPFVFGAKSLKRIKIAANAVRYYNTIGRPITNANMHFTNVLKGFNEQWQSLVRKGSDADPDTPCITRSLPIMKWTESFTDFLSQVIGHREIPLSYLIRDTDIVPVAAPVLLNHRSYSAEHASVEGELIARASHEHEKYKDDNARLYGYIEEATRTTQYAASIRTFSRKKDGRAAWKAINAQFAGKDKWQQAIKDQENFIYTRVWKGNTNFSLESFANQHRNGGVTLERCAEHVPHQLRTKRSMVVHFLDAIQCSDPSLQAAIAHVKSNDVPGGMMHDFEETVAYLLQFDPVAKKRTNKQGNSRQQQVASIDQSLVGDGKLKANKGKTGVDLRYHKPEDYRQLNEEQKLELKEWRESNPNKKKRKGGNKGNSSKKKQKSMKDQLISALSEIAEDDEKDDQVITKDWVIAAIQSANAPLPPPPSGTSLPKQCALQKILNRTKRS